MDNFFQSQNWLFFQKAFGRRVFWLEKENFKAGLIEHKLPIAGTYLYCPRGPIFARIKNQELRIKEFDQEIINLAKKEKPGWIRIEPETEQILEMMQKEIDCKIVKAPYDVQPKENFVLDLTKSEDELLAQMKSKTRYNIRLAQKKEVSIKKISNEIQGQNDKYVEEFLNLTKQMAARQGIVAHPEEYYRKMFGAFPEGMLQLYAAQYAGKTIAVNLVLFFGDTATYLHGASADEQRNVMAPFLLQWQAIVDAKKAGCRFYDFGGVQTNATQHKAHSDLAGVTNFKLGFAPNSKTVVFPGTFDVVINLRAYALYRGLQKAKMLLRKIRK